MQGKQAVVTIGVTLLAATLGCATNQRRPAYNTVTDPENRDSLEAQTANDEGLSALKEDDLELARSKFAEALEYDLSYAPAHNNLGLALMRKCQYYEAAWEFQYAAKLMPHAREPRANLALLYETIGRLDRAAGEYEAVLEMNPDDLTAMQHLARTYVKANKKTDRTAELLHKLFKLPLDKQWDAWVRGQLVRLGRYEETTQ